MELPIILGFLAVAGIGAAVYYVRQTRRATQALIRRGGELALKAGLAPQERAELVTISARLTRLSPLLDYRQEPRERLRWLPDDTYRLVTTGLDGSEIPRDLEEFAQIVAMVHLGGGSRSPTVWSGQALEFAQRVATRRYATALAAGSDDAAATELAQAGARDMVEHYFAFCVHPISEALSVH